MESVAGSNTGVYVGSFCRDYRDEVYWDPEQIPVYSSTGTEQSVLSNRISYFYDLKGPSLSVDTACSSSLTAFHIACQSLRTGESQQAIVGGANLMIGPNMPISLSMMRQVSDVIPERVRLLYFTASYLLMGGLSRLTPEQMGMDAEREWRASSLKRLKPRFWTVTTLGQSCVARG